MKRSGIIFLFVILFFLSTDILSAASGYKKKIVIAGEIDYPPYSFYNEKGEPSGFSIEITQAILKVMNIDAEIVLKPWNQVRTELEQGEIDIIPGMFYSPERASTYELSPPFSIISDSIFERKDGLHADSVEDLRNRVVIVMAGEAMHDYLIEHGITDTIIAAKTIDEAINLFASGEGDFVLTAKIPGLYWINKHNYSDIIIAGNPVKAFKNCFAARKGNTELLMLFSEGLNIINQTGEYNDIYNKWFGVLEGKYYKRELIIKYSIAVVVPLIIFIILLFLFMKLLKSQVNKATEDLRQREATLRSYIDNAPDGVFITDENGNYVEINSAAESITGYSQSELLTKSIADMLPPEYIDQGLNHFRQLKDIGHGQIDLKFLHKSGEKRWWSLYAVKLSESRYLGFTKDITDKKNDEKRILNLLAEKELLLKEVHHRIKNNMNTIKGLLTLQIHSEDNPQIISSLQSAENRVHSMIMLYDRLYSTDNYREISVKEYLEPLASEIIGGFPGSINLTIETEINDFILNVRLLTPLGIIVNELLTNIMKYAFNGRESGKIFLSAALENNRVKVVIWDNGVGIPETVDFGSTTGFGLDLVKMLTEQIEGNIRFERGDGTRFVLEFDL